MPSRVHFRNPYAIPDLSTEGFWLPPGPVLGDKVDVNDRRWKSKLEPHDRLFAHHTLNSIRKDQRLVRKQEPNDALDLALTAIYVHNEDTLVPKMYVPMQPEAMGHETWRVLRNELRTSSPQFGFQTVAEETSSGGSGGVATFEDVPSERERRFTGMEMAGYADSKMADVSGQMAGVSGQMASASGRMAGAAGKMSGRAASAPAGSNYGSSAIQLHRYAGRTRHGGIPDRIERIHPSSLKLGFQGPHMDRTNAGYSRKEDGTFYSI